MAFLYNNNIVGIYSDFLYDDSEDDSNAIYLDDTKNTSQKPTIKKIDKNHLVG